MCELLAGTYGLLAAANPITTVVQAVWPILLIFLGFSAVIFVHELGHFAVAKWCGVRVEKFAVGFFREVVGFTRGETRYSFNILPLGGYVKMLGQEDFDIDKSGELRVREDPRAFSNKPVGQRMLIVSAGVVMNVLFAGLLFMIVFMTGKTGRTTEVGFVKPNWPAAHAGVEAGDVIERIDRREVEEFDELRYAIMLAAPLEPIEFQVRRQGQLRHFEITPLNNEDDGILQVGIAPAVTAIIGAAAPGSDPDGEDCLRAGDRVVEVDGQEVTDANANEMMWRLMFMPTVMKHVVVERADSSLDARGQSGPLARTGPSVSRGTRRVSIQLPVQFGIIPSDPQDKEALRGDVLGLTPLARVASVEPGGRAYLGDLHHGLEVGDIVLKFGNHRYPTHGDMARTIQDHGEIDIPMVIERDGRQVQLSIRPKIKTGLLGGRKGRPRMFGALFDAYATNLLRIGHVVRTIDGRESPAARSGIPEGALITQVNEQPVQTWPELIARFRDSAGTTVTLTYQHQGRVKTCSFSVPESIRTRLNQPSYATITAIDGEEDVTVEVGGTPRSFSVRSPFGLREILKRKIGETVTVTYAKSPFDAPEQASLEVTEDMVDPWLGRIMFYADIRPIEATKSIRKGPIGAVKLGVWKTLYFVLSVYTTIERMVFSRSMGVENLSGPVGIVKIGQSVARVGFVELLFFLAMISANLAVLNFLPLPIVDGGLMVFLLIEKIKGSPVNLKVQMATQVIGIILLATVFLFVTIQDFTK